MATQYTVHDSSGPRLQTDSPFVAEAHSRVGFRVTAVTEGSRRRHTPASQFE